MASREEHVDDRAALLNLARLLAEDVSSVDAEELVRGAQQAERLRDAAPEITGRLLAELHARGNSWPVLARMTGFSQSTCYRRAEPYLPK